MTDLTPKIGPGRMLVSWVKEGEEMAKRKHTPEEITNKLREAEVMIAAASTVAEASRRIGVSEQTFCRWCAEYGVSPDGPGPATQAAGDRERSPQGGRWLNSLWTTRYSRRPRRETSEPRPPPPLRTTCQVGPGSIGAACLQGAGAAPLDPAP